MQDKAFELVIESVKELKTEVKESLSQLTNDVKTLLVDVGVLKAKAGIYGIIGGSIASVILKGLF